MDPRLAGGYLTVDLLAIQKNYALLSKLVSPADCAGVVKADAYGLGVDKVAPALFEAGCRSFFVALPEEGVELRRILPVDSKIYILNGLFDECEEVYAHERLTPVLNSLDEIKRWSALTEKVGPLPAILHLETGICRLGLTESAVDELAANPGYMDGIELRYIMSHLASADAPDADQNAEQMAELNRLLEKLPDGLRNTPISFANSSGIFLGNDYHLQLARPGVALYGGNPTPDKENPMQPVVNWQGKILQVHDVDSEKPVGYGATYHTKRKSRIAIVSIGYADGYFRNLGNQGSCVINDNKVPVIGRVSMDMIAIDVTSIPEEKCRRGDLVDLIGKDISLDDLAKQAGTISYEILTSLGKRCHRRYLEAGV